ncbi:aminotransferase class I/II-fold pyridoxal phosphate-dependent enzyme [Streptomyces sp. NPDC052299]|uniref:aminotransferase class I/II-fold pyridoxal phosphate-dependent enzyme n=1 Tax=Streptomyces sp. NPDC052299 TaxID=3155054 RepID=UPI00341AC64D
MTYTCQQKLRVARAGISPALERDTIAELGRLLAEFETQYAGVAEDEPSRFPFLCRWAYQVLTSRNQESGGGSEGPVDCIPGERNLDTGDASAAPLPSFVHHLSVEVGRGKDFQRYFGPECTEELDTAVRELVAGLGFPLARHLDQVEPVVGVGTISLYDALCRTRVTVPGDVVLHPEVSYGFFLPQPYRAGGTVATVPLGEDGAVDIDALDRVVTERNAALYAEWLPQRSVLVRGTLRDLHSRGLLGDVAAPCPEDAEEITRGLEELGPLRAARTMLKRAASRWPALRNAQPLHRGPALVLRPPRVVCYLHINPTVTGRMATPEHLRRLGEVLGRHQVAAIEDMSYHSIRSMPEDCGTLLDHHPDTFVLFGLSKPFALANLRIGLLWSPRTQAESVRRVLESTIGFVYTGFQNALARAMRTGAEEIRAYLAEESWHQENSYEFRRHLMVAMVEGIGSARIPDAQRGRVRSVVLDEVDRLLRWKFAQGVVLCPPGLREHPVDASHYDELDARTREFHRELAERFLDEGLSRWFAVEYEPECGFFLVVHCDAVLDRGGIGPVAVERTFHLFGVLSYLLGVRVVPEEMMAPPGKGIGRHRIRLSFSPPVENLVRCMFTCHQGLTWLEEQPSFR